MNINDINLNENSIPQQLKCILKYLYSFFTESFQYCPLDCIANFIIEMLLYVSTMEYSI